jgi:Protein kinase domain
MSSFHRASKRRSEGEQAEAMAAETDQHVDREAVQREFTTRVTQAEVVKTWQAIQDNWDKLNEDPDQQDFHQLLLNVTRSIPHLSEEWKRALQRLEYLINLLEAKNIENQTLRASSSNEIRDGEIQRLKAEIKSLEEDIKSREEDIKLPEEDSTPEESDANGHLAEKLNWREQIKLRDQLRDQEKNLGRLRDEMRNEEIKLRNEENKLRDEMRNEETKLRNDLNKEKSKLFHHVRSTREAHKDVDSDLRYLSFSQSESSAKIWCTADATSGIAGCQPERTPRTLKTEITFAKLACFTDGNEFFRLDKKFRKILCQFNSSFQHAFMNAKSVCVFRVQGEHEYKTYLAGLEAFGQQLCCPRVNSNSSANIPSPTSAEVWGAQPYLLVFLQELRFAFSQGGQQEASDAAPIVQPSLTSPLVATSEPSLTEESTPLEQMPASSSPSKIVLFNRKVRCVQGEHERIVDVSIAPVARHLLEFRVDAPEIAVEIKTFCTKGDGPQSLIKTAREQVLSRLAKQVDVGFNFAGIGMDTQATGVVLTPSCVEILQLRVVDVGTKNVKLKVLKTGCLPLLSRENYDVWIAGVMKDKMYKTHWKEVNDHTSELYGSTMSTVDGVPAGLEALASLFTTSRKYLFSVSPIKPSTTTVSSGSVSIELESMIGFGAFASVYACHGEHRNTVLKVSRHGEMAELLQESEVLKALGSGSNFHPTVRSLLDPCVQMAGLELPIKALWLEPRAINIQWALANNWTTLSKIGRELINCLAHVHNKGFAHNDISPKNIMVHPQTRHAMLIDFGLAAPLRTDIVGFRGNVLYAHRSIFAFYGVSTKWICNTGNDEASLALSLAVISNNGVCPWRPPRKFWLSNSGRMDTWATERWEIASDQLHEAGLLADPWKGWCSSSKLPSEPSHSPNKKPRKST